LRSPPSYPTGADRRVLEITERATPATALRLRSDLDRGCRDDRKIVDGIAH
jgi:hypothetical protein